MVFQYHLGIKTLHADSRNEFQLERTMIEDEPFKANVPSKIKLLELAFKKAPFVEIKTSVAAFGFEDFPGSVVKEARIEHLEQPMPEGGGREFRNIRVTLIRVNRPETPEFSFVLQFQVRAEKWCSVAGNSGVDIRLMRDYSVRKTVFDGRIKEMRYPEKWYTVSRDGELDAETFTIVNRVKFQANRDRVQPC